MPLFFLLRVISIFASIFTLIPPPFIVSYFTVFSNFFLSSMHSLLLFARLFYLVIYPTFIFPSWLFSFVHKSKGTLSLLRECPARQPDNTSQCYTNNGSTIQIVQYCYTPLTGSLGLNSIVCKVKKIQSCCDRFKCRPIHSNYADRVFLSLKRATCLRSRKLSLSGLFFNYSSLQHALNAQKTVICETERECSVGRPFE